MAHMKLRLIAHTILYSSKIIPSINGGKIKKSVSLFQKRNNRLNLTGNLLKPSDVQVHLVLEMKEKEDQILTKSENFLNKVPSRTLLYRDYHITNVKGKNITIESIVILYTEHSVYDIQYITYNMYGSF